MPPQLSLVNQIKAEARRLGFDAVGIARRSNAVFPSCLCHLPKIQFLPRTHL